MFSITGMTCVRNGRNVLMIDRLVLAPGRIHLVAGHNGAGKTTLLRILAGLDYPTSGSVRVDPPTGGLAFCSQRPYMFAGSVYDNVVFARRYRPDALDDSEIKSLLQNLKVGRNLWNQRAKRLSAGELQKVALARSLVTRPRVLLLDEPTANVDEEGIDAIVDEILRQNQGGVTVIMATHDPDMGFRMHASVIRLEDGKMVEEEKKNVFEGEILHQGGLSWIQLAGDVRIRCITHETGRRRISFRARDVVLSRHKLDSSMANHWPGRVTAIDSGEDLVEVTVDIGVPVVALISAASARQLAVAEAERLVVSFKATAVAVQ